MKKFWLVLLTLGLITAFSTSAMAVDVKFSGSFYAAGLYQDKTTVKANEGSSTAFYYQRLRVKTEFTVSPGLKLITRFDAMERAWGATRTNPDNVEMLDSAGTRAENENIAFDLAYVSYNSPIGTFEVGYKEKGLWGTDFANTGKPTGAIYWGKYFPGANLYLWGQIFKIKENSSTAKVPSAYSDRDNDEYMLGIHYFGIKNVEISLLYDYLRYANGRNGYQGWAPGPSGFVWSDYGYVSAAHLFEPVIKAKFGPVYVEAEVDYAFGDYVKYDGQHPGYENMDLSNLQAYVKVLADFGPAYVGGIFAYVAGDDFASKDKYEGGYLNGGREFNPALIMFNSERSDWAGVIAGHSGTTSIGGPMTNAYFAQLRAGVKPMDKLDIMASASYATADKTPQATWVGREYGYEVDLTATYKITNNLSYMLGAGYFFTGDYYKGASEANEVKDDFLVINKLTLTF